MDGNIDGLSEQLVSYIGSLPAFEKLAHIDGNYGHMGATLADAVLQSNNNYDRSVRPRIAEIRADYADHVSLEELRHLLRQMTAQQFLRWNGTRKPKTFLELVDLLVREGVNTEDELRQWLLLDGSRDKVCEIRFIGPKTADYLKILVGLPETAIDRHILGFLELAGIIKLNYNDSQDIVRQTADLMGLDRAHLDHSIWRYMTKATKTTRTARVCRTH